MQVEVVVTMGVVLHIQTVAGIPLEQMCFKGHTNKCTDQVVWTAVQTVRVVVVDQAAWTVVQLVALKAVHRIVVLCPILNHRRKHLLGTTAVTIEVTGTTVMAVRATVVAVERKETDATIDQNVQVKTRKQIPNDTEFVVNFLFCCLFLLFLRVPSQGKQVGKTHRYVLPYTYLCTSS